MAKRGTIPMGSIDGALDHISTRIRSGSNFLKIQNGKNFIRLIPVKGYDGELTYGVYTSMHFGLDKEPFHCPVTLGEECPICEVQKQLRNSEEKSDKKQAEKLRATQRYTCYAVVRGKPDQIGLLDVPVSVMKDILTLCRTYEDSMYVAEHDLIIVREGEQRETKYTVLPGAECEVGMDYEEERDLGSEIRDRVRGTKGCLKVLEEQGFDVGDLDDDEDEKPSKPSKTSKRRDEEDDEEEDEKPSKSSKSSNKRRDEDDEDEEDEKPSKSSGGEGIGSRLSRFKR